MKRKQKRVWKKFYRHNFIRKVFNYGMVKIKLNKFFIKPKYKNYVSLEQTQEKIKEFILKGEPKLIARFGSNEARCTAEAIGIDLKAKKDFKQKTTLLITRNAGVFPKNKDMLLRYGRISMQAAKEVDLIGEWNTDMQDYLIKKICSSETIVTNLRNLEPYYSDNPWTKALKGKKVLVIHPFAETIKSQYKKRKLLFSNPDMLPEFELKIIKAVQTIAGEKDERFSDWEMALKYMYESAMKEDFDVAIIGCGAYGMPLGSMLKKSGKVAIHLGGATQLLFGIRGNRWENHPVISKLFNEHWVRPSDDEKPKSATSIENSCYW